MIIDEQRITKMRQLVENAKKQVQSHHLKALK